MFSILILQDKLYFTTSPNDGGLQLVGDLGVNFEGTG
jgi:hypothetical protein